MAHKLTTCTFCGVGCGLYLETSGNQVVGVYPSVSHPANQGRICVRGWHVHEIASSPDRLKKPLLRKNGEFQEVSWDEALGFIATRLREIRDRYGPDSLAFLNSPRCSNGVPASTNSIAELGESEVIVGGGHLMRSVP